MRLPLGSLSLLVGLVLVAARGDAASERPPARDAVAAGYLLALGRLPSVEEAGREAGEESAGVSAVIERLRDRLSREPELRAAAAALAYQDAFGRPPPASQRPRAAEAATYAELVQRQLEQLAQDPAEYERVIRRAYRFVVRRDAYPEEIEYWRRHDTTSYALLVACIEDWGRRNQPGLMVTTGTPTVPINSEFLLTVRLSPNEANDARRALGQTVEGWSIRGREAAARRNLVAPGGAGLVTAGGIHFVAVGGPRLASFGWPEG